MEDSHGEDVEEEFKEWEFSKVMRIKEIILEKIKTSNKGPRILEKINKKRASNKTKVNVTTIAGHKRKRKINTHIGKELKLPKSQ